MRAGGQRAATVGTAGTAEAGSGPRAIGLRLLLGGGAVAVAGVHLLFGGMLALAVAVLAFPYPVETLTPTRMAPLRVLDRHGTLLATVQGERYGSPHGEWVPLDRIPSHAVLALLTSEDQRFFAHHGVDPWAVLRAAWLNLRAGRVAYGGSTLTMQLVRLVHSAGEPRTVGRKLEEAVLALRLERNLGKRAILEQYLNRACFGHGATGIEAAAQTYFGKPATSLSVGEATLLAVLPRGPSAYDPIRRLAQALRRRAHVLELLERQGLLTAGEARRAASQPLSPAVHRAPLRAPHFVEWALGTLPPVVRASGGSVHTTLDGRLQDELERKLQRHVDSLRDARLDQAGLVVLDTASGEVRAMVGSAGFFERQGQINIVTRRRHPGSALKPFVYALAIELGDTAASIAYDILDVPSAYRVAHSTQPERGPVRYREALAGSYNLAAVHVLEKVGVERVLTRLRQASVGELLGSPSEYGLRLALGSAKVRLLDLASAYGFLGRGGRIVPATAVSGVALADGTQWRPQPRPETRIFSPEVSWLVMDMLADPDARAPAFGLELPLDLPYRVAAKTGTARGFSDTVAVAVTRELTVAAWAGNFDGRPTHGLVAMQSAAPLVRAGLLAAGRGRSLTLARRPAGIVPAVVCPLSGELPGQHCPGEKREMFVAGTEPRQRCTWHRAADQAGASAVAYPTEISGWAERQRRRGGRHL